MKDEVDRVYNYILCGIESHFITNPYFFAGFLMYDILTKKKINVKFCAGYRHFIKEKVLTYHLWIEFEGEKYVFDDIPKEDYFLKSMPEGGYHCIDMDSNRGILAITNMCTNYELFKLNIVDLNFEETNKRIAAYKCYKYFGIIPTLDMPDHRNFLWLNDIEKKVIIKEALEKYTYVTWVKKFLLSKGIYSSYVTEKRFVNNVEYSMTYLEVDGVYIMSVTENINC